MIISCLILNFDYTKLVSYLKIVQAVAGGASPVSVTIATGSGTQSILTGFTKVGWARFVNLDETNFVTIGGPTDQLAKMKPLEPAYFRLNDALSALWLKADTAACEVLLQIFED